jgi:Na+/melibiose symporter-like transporter
MTGTPPQEASVPGRAELLALSLPSFVFSGYELARKTYLPVLLAGAAGLDLVQTGLILTIVHGWSILVEVLFGMICDLAPDPRHRRGFWIAVGTVLQMGGGAVLWLAAPHGRSVFLWLLGLLPLASGWVLSNLAHGAWALEQADGVLARGRIFGGRAQAGMAGSILFATALLWSRHASQGLDDFYVILLLTLIGAPLAHGWLIWRVRERGGGSSASTSPRLDWAGVVKPFQLCIASPADRRLASLFLLVGMHMAVIGGSFLFIARHRIALPDWGTPGILAQSLAAMVGTGIAPHLLRRMAPQRMLLVVFTLNLVLALALPWLPVGQVVPLLLWSAGTGATMAVDFMLLRVVLGQRLDRDRLRDGDAPAAAFYAGFHLPLNIGVMLGTALLFRGLAWTGLDGAGFGLTWLICGLAALCLLPALACVIALGQALRAEGQSGTPQGNLNIRILEKIKSLILTEHSSHNCHLRRIVGPRRNLGYPNHDQSPPDTLSHACLAAGRHSHERHADHGPCGGCRARRRAAGRWPASARPDRGHRRAPSGEDAECADLHPFIERRSTAKQRLSVTDRPAIHHAGPHL